MPTNGQLGKKEVPRENTLAYLSGVSLEKKKVLLNVHQLKNPPGANVIKLFCP